MTWDIAFLVRNYPREYRFRDRNYVMADVHPRHVDLLRKHTAHIPSVAAYFDGTDSNDHTAVLFRIEAEAEDDALELARHILDGFIDGLAVLLDRNLPKKCPLLQVRRDRERDIFLIEFGDSGWAYFHAKEPSSEAIWRSRCKSVFRALFPFFDVVAKLHPHRDTSLSRQLMYSMKMYRHGAGTGVFGLEYICKWSALEGLVCGGEPYGKLSLLRTRIPQLFTSEFSAIEAKVDDLWKLRNEAVHEARAFDSDYLHEAPLLGPQIEEVERLFLVVVMFALSNIDRADSVQTLWAHARSYTLPEWAIARPKDMPRMAMTKLRFNTKLAIVGGGVFFDGVFNDTAAKDDSSGQTDNR
jgi:hypothetical protein